MNDNIPVIKLPEFATLNDHLLDVVAYARESVSYRVGYRVERPRSWREGLRTA